MALFVLLVPVLPSTLAEAAQPGQISLPARDATPQNTTPVHTAPHHVLLKLDDGVNLPGFSTLAIKHGFRHLRHVYGSDWYIFSIPAHASPRATAALARSLPGVVAASTDPIVSLDVLPPRDPLYIEDDDPSAKSCDPLVDVCDSADVVDQWGLFRVGAEDAWNVTTGSDSVVIAVIDSGVDLDHDDLAGNIWNNPAEMANGIDDDGNGFIDDLHGADFAGDNVGDLFTDDVSSQDANPDIPMGGTWINDPLAYPWGIRFDGDPAVGDAVDNNLDLFADQGVFHGTFVAAIAAAMTDNINPESGEFEGMAGACWNCKIMPVRMINAEGNGYGSDAAAAIYYATDMGADIINLSWGFDLDSLDATGQAEVAIISDAVNHAVAQGVIVVASAGNSGGPALRFPASMANTIAVGSSNWLDRRSEFSTIAAPGEVPDNGVDDDGNGQIDDALDVVAPGELIWSGSVYSAYDSLLSQLLGDPAIEPGLDAYGNSNGTSFSAPLAAGYVGLLLSRFPGATLNDIRQALRSYALDLLDPEGTGSTLSGYDAYSGFGRLNMVVPDSLGDPPTAPLPPPPAGPVIPLLIDVVDSGLYGHRYGTDEHKTLLVATFLDDGASAYELGVTGYDIDSSDEVAVYLNDGFIAHLSPGPDNDLNSSDIISLDPGLLLGGENRLEFRQRTAGFTWGVTGLGVRIPPPPPPPPPPPLVVVLTVDTPDTGQYGNNYGSNEHETVLVATFEDDGTSSYELQVTGYDVDYTDEISVTVNGSLIGHLATGPNLALNAGDVFVLDPGMLQAGTNTIEFEVSTPGYTWGVTNLAVMTPGAPPPPPPPSEPVVVLTVDTPDTGQYGNNYGSNEHETVLVATFEGDGTSSYELQVTGYDVDYTDEISVTVNGSLIGHLATGPNLALNAGDVFVLDPGMLQAGTNTIEFEVSTPGFTWGVTNLAVMTPGAPPPPPPPSEPVVVLTVDTPDTGQYGNNYGSNEHPTVLVATFEGDGTSSYELQVTGYDVDYTDEISVTVNGSLIGYLATGPNLALNAGDVFVLDPGMLQAGTNTIEFEVSTPGFTWGVTNLAVMTPGAPPPPPPPSEPVVVLTVDTPDTGQYGNNYGSNEHPTVLVATFEGDGTSSYELQVTGYDVDYTDEISVTVNGSLIGYLSKGKNNRLNAGDVFVLDPGMLQAGTNTIEFEVSTPGYTWGVTNLGVMTPGAPPPPPPPSEPVVVLTVDTPDTGQYGNNYGSNEHPTVLVATFEGDGTSSYELQVTGYDVDYTDEISVTVNGNLIGYLSKGKNKQLNAGDVFVLDTALLNGGVNTIEFEVSTPGFTWGVTNLGVMTPGMP
ncbi:MAG: S8 family serine peptidase [Pseudomonadota bacterium]